MLLTHTWLSTAAPAAQLAPLVERFVAEAGAGVTCDLARASVDEVRAQLASLCADGPARAAARRIADSYRAAGGAATVADAIAGLLR